MSRLFVDLGLVAGARHRCISLCTWSISGAGRPPVPSMPRLRPFLRFHVLSFSLAPEPPASSDSSLSTAPSSSSADAPLPDCVRRSC